MRPEGIMTSLGTSCPRLRCSRGHVRPARTRGGSCWAVSQHAAVVPTRHLASRCWTRFSWTFPEAARRKTFSSPVPTEACSSSPSALSGLRALILGWMGGKAPVGSNNISRSSVLTGRLSTVLQQCPTTPPSFSVQCTIVIFFLLVTSNARTSNSLEHVFFAASILACRRSPDSYCM